MMKSQLSIAVDLDGTLIREESHWVLWRYVWTTHPSQIFPILRCLLKEGKSAAKEKIASLCPLDQFQWTLNELLIEKLKAFSQEDVPLILITGAPLSVAQTVADQVKIFHSVFASSPDVNLVGTTKVKILKDSGYPHFIYVGNSFKDFQVWRHAAQAWIVNASWFFRFLSRLLLKNPVFL